MNGELYTGITQDLSNRLLRHVSGRGGRFTKGNRPVKILYHESFQNRELASAREIQIKKWSRAKKLALIGNDILKLQELSISRD